MKLISYSSLLIGILALSYFTSIVVGQNITQKRQEILEKFRSRPKDGLPVNMQDLIKKHSDRIQALNNETQTRNKSSSFQRKHGRNLRRYGSSSSTENDDLFEDGRIAGVIIGAFSGFFLLMTSCCWCAQCQKHNFQNGILVLKCKCHKNRLICKKRTPKYRKINSEFQKATQRGIVGLPDQEIMRQVALNNPAAHQMVMGTTVPIIMGQPGMYQPGFMPNPALGNINQPMVMHGNPLYPPTYNQNAYGQQMGPGMQPMNMMMQPPQNMQYPGNNSIQPTNMNDYQHMNNQNAMYQHQQQMQQPQIFNQMDQNQSQQHSLQQAHNTTDNKIFNQ
ncbi:UNKNOWN [Stylonychia lemnae]|uniref:Uncharacterized protein n=1 Tax=Stylonychia lemnae TaxID=5949 RepID=A0A078AWK7_STYLE|nr:UNKNOWN [Stylonychia lemnae]|eukprot:CDW86539.1 UNKNOWN [Stylonychia lemnae]